MEVTDRVYFTGTSETVPSTDETNHDGAKEQTHSTEESMMDTNEECSNNEGNQKQAEQSSLQNG